MVVNRIQFGTPWRLISNSWDLLKFPKLKCILLDQNTEFTEEDSSDLHDPM